VILAIINSIKKGNEIMTKSQMKGYLYEVLVSHLLVQNNFKKCRKSDETMDCGLKSKIDF